jgi:hypothetical protein
MEHLARILRLSSVTLAISLAAFLHALPCGAEPGIYRGKAFSDPSAVQHMPLEWEEKKVEYQSSIDADIVISLDQQMYRVLLPSVKAYARKKGLKIVVLDSTCGNAMGLLKKKNIDMGGLCCPPGGTDRLPGLRFHTLGITPIAIIVNPENPLRGLKLDEVRRIFMGTVYRWSELKGEDGAKGKNWPIQTEGRLHCKKRPGHWRLLLDNEELFSPRLHEVGTIPDMIRMVSRNRNSIGHASIWLALEHYRDVGQVAVLRVDGHDPADQESVVSGDYPLYKTFSLAVWDGPAGGNPHVAGLIRELEGRVEALDKGFMIIPASRLRDAGWRFHGSELIGEPEK